MYKIEWGERINHGVRVPTASFAVNSRHLETDVKPMNTTCIHCWNWENLAHTLTNDEISTPNYRENWSKIMCVRANTSQVRTDVTTNLNDPNRLKKSYRSQRLVGGGGVSPDPEITHILLSFLTFSFFVINVRMPLNAQSTLFIQLLIVIELTLTHKSCFWHSYKQNHSFPLPNAVLSSFTR